jgi:hypothetical protein
MPHYDPLIFYSAVSGALADLLIFVVWCYALARVRRGFLWILVFSTFLFVLSVGFNALMAYDPRILMGWLGSREAFKTFYYVYIWAQPVNIFIFAFGQILLVRWMIKADRTARPSASALFSRRI